MEEGKHIIDIFISHLAERPEKEKTQEFGVRFSRQFLPAIYRNYCDNYDTISNTYIFNIRQEKMIDISYFSIGALSFICILVGIFIGAIIGILGEYNGWFGKKESERTIIIMFDEADYEEPTEEEQNWADENSELIEENS